MRRLWIRTLLLLSALMPVAALPLVGLYRAGEFTTIDEALARQSTDRRVLFGPAYFEPNPYYKLKAIALKRPKTLVLGTSRTMQIRAGFFKNPDEFYNGGGAATRIRDLRALLERLPSNAQPKLLLVGLDQYFFNLNWDSLQAEPVLPSAADRAGQLRSVTEHWRDVYFDFLKRKFSLDQLAGADRIGLQAKALSTGYRNDGSFRYGQQLAHFVPLTERFQDTMDRITSGAHRFEHGATVSEPALRELERLLGYCKAHGIEVVAFLPPFPHAVYLRMVASSNYRYLGKLPLALDPIFKKSGFKLYDFTDLASLGATDRETFDGHHASERAYLRMLVRMSRGSPALAAQVDTEKLDHLSNSARNSLSVFND